MLERINLARQSGKNWFLFNNISRNKSSSFLLIIILTLSGLIIISGQCVYADTFVEGHISIDTTWTVANSPYVISNDVHVDEGVTLTIEPGTKVKFGGRFSIFVKGNLNARGTKNNNIIFTSNKLDPQPGDWSTIKLSGEADSSLHLEYCSIGFAENGITTSGSGRAEIINTLFMNISHIGAIIGNTGRTEIIASVFMHISEYGITLQSESNSLIKNNTISYNGAGIYTLNAFFKIEGNEIASNTAHGIFINGNHGIICNNKISFNEYGIKVRYWKAPKPIVINGNKIFSNNGMGIEVWLVTNEGSNLTICNNTVFLNKDTGIFSKCYHSYTKIYDNIIFLNKRGMDVSYNNKVIVITTNIISANKWGITIRSFANISHNSICYNEFGVVLSSPRECQINFNDIYNNKIGMERFDLAGASVEHNYWGNSTGPYHISLNPKATGDAVDGNGVDFVPFLTSPVGIINQRPIPSINADRIIVGIGEEVKFDASSSTDDQRVVNYYFDYGDDKNIGWVTTSVVVHRYSSERIFNVTLKVRDEYGVESDTVSYVLVTVKENQLSSVASLNNSSNLDIDNYTNNEDKRNHNSRDITTQNNIPNDGYESEKEPFFEAIYVKLEQLINTIKQFVGL